MTRQTTLCSIHLALPLLLGTACLDVENPLAADADGDGKSIFEGDCDDTDPDHTGSFLWFKDADGDGFGNPNATQEACEQPGPAWILDDSSDCDDSDANTFPGAAEKESDTACQRDQDDDGWGDSSGDLENIEAGSDCDDSDYNLNRDDADGDGFSSCDEDCDDNNASLSPIDGDQDGSSLCDGDCDDNNAQISAGDLDGDGYSACGTGLNFDCDDNDSQTYPGAAENESNASACQTDADQDGWGSRTPNPGVEAGTDCNDLDGSQNQDDEDSDGYSTCEDDCDDSDYLTYPGAAYREPGSQCQTDQDGDGFGADNPLFFVTPGTDCDDSRNDVHPAVDEICDGIDNDCDGSTDDNDSDVTGTSLFYRDSDGDDYGDGGSSLYACDPPTGYVSDWTDCDDSDNSIYPNAGDSYADGIDSDCDGLDCQATTRSGAYFAFCPDEKWTWEDANSACQSAGYDGLTTVLGVIEQELMNNLMVQAGLDNSESAWIGIDSSDFNLWFDGTTVSYENWAIDEPSYGAGYCVHMNTDLDGTGTWNDVPCTDEEWSMWCGQR